MLDLPEVRFQPVRIATLHGIQCFDGLMETRELLIVEWARESPSTRRMLDSIPEDRFTWKPHPKSKELGALALHVAALPGRFSSVFATEMFDPTRARQPDISGKSDIMTLFDSGSAKVEEGLRNTPESEYGREFTFSREGTVIARMPKAMFLRTFLVNHMIHHRAQLSVYLRLLDVPVPGMYGPSADDLQS